MITVSVNGIDKAIKNIEKITDELESKMMRLCKELVDESAYIADKIFTMYASDEDVFVWTVPVKNGWNIIADGEKVCFVEFGAGIYSQDSIMNPGIKIYPGSWSETHKRTYQEWIKSGKPLDEYPYNLQPANAMLQAYNAILENFDKFAERILND